MDNLVYGVQIKMMRKVLVVRTPYVFFNRTKLTCELRVIQVFADEEIARFTLEPDGKYALDFEYLNGSLEHAVQVRVVDKT